MYLDTVIVGFNGSKFFSSIGTEYYNLSTFIKINWIRLDTSAILTLTNFSRYFYFSGTNELVALVL